MAKIKVEFDTKSKELKVSMNGDAIPDIYSVTFYTDWNDKEKGYVELQSVATDDKESMTKITRIMANEEEFIVMRDDAVNAELSQLFLNRKKK